tara:strand:- start:601 stop:1497 length:897 start_codon:yes stop_codon:yes gene_type:complete
MADRFPLIVDSSSQQIKELPDGDSLLLGDSERLKIGDDNDLNIYHNGTNSIIQNMNANDLVIQNDGDDSDIFFKSDNGSGGIATYLMLDGGLGILRAEVGMRFADSAKLRLGTGNDLQVYHDGSNSYIDNTTGDLYIRDSGGDIYIQAKSGENSISALDDGAVSLFYDGSAKVATTSEGASVTGRLTATASAKITQVALTSSSNAVAWDALTAANAYYATTENTTFAAPGNAVEGAIISVEIAQGSTAYTVAWNTVYEFAASTAPTVTATANKTDIFAFRYNGSVWQEIGRVQNLAQT